MPSSPIPTTKLSAPAARWPNTRRRATAAYELAADPDCFPERDACQPHQVSKLYYRVMPQAMLDAWNPEGRPAAVMMDGVESDLFDRLR